MFLQFSPPVRQKPKKPVQKNEETEEATLTLGPFTATPKIVFENIKINQSKDEKLVIKNPRPSPIKITATITLSDDINLQINWSQEEIQGDSSTCLILTWTPSAVGSWRSILHVGDGGRFLRDIPIIMKSVGTDSSKKKKITTKKNLPRCVTKRTSPRLKLKKKSPVLPNVATIKISSPDSPYGGKENLPDFNERIVEQVFDDSLEDAAGASFEALLRSHCLTPKHQIFTPEYCSTDVKSPTGKSVTFMGRKLELFKEEAFTFNMGRKQSPNLLNISSRTYTKHDTTEIGSTATPPTASQRIRLNSLIGSSVKEALEANLWSNNNNLVPIKEEPSSFEMKQTVKRKLDVTFTEVAPKRPHLQPWAKPRTAPTIDHETATWLEQREEDFKKWLNAVLAPPSDLISDNQSHPLNVAKLWRQCQKKELETLPPSQVVTSSRLKELRKSARLLYRSTEIRNVLTNVWAAIDSQKLSMREDRDVHLDIAIQSSLMTVLLSYNPLWLRLGLETIYRRDIPLRNNSDIVGLTSFLSEHFFKDPLLLKKYRSVHIKNYKIEIKKFILKKFLALIYFLDFAKRKRLIPHDPCLFCRNAPIKESREALLELSRETLSSMGDVTKYLRHFKYVVEYKQSFLDEFDYTVNIFGCDLRDGIRLTKVLEVILLRTDLSKNLRVPAISRLQKVHNMKMVFDVLEKSNFQILHEITPKDIVDGHKEKTLSFIWQIIYKFQTPLMKKSATTIIKWWRSRTIAAKREQLREIRKTKEKAAKIIQIWYRKKKLQELRKREKEEETKRKAAAFERCVIFVQRKWRLKVAMRNERIKYQAAVVIQRKWRAVLAARAERQNFLRLKHFVIDIQRKWRATLMMKAERETFLLLKSTTIMIQRRFRATVAMREQMIKFQAQRDAAVVIQRKWRAVLAARAERQNFLRLKHFVIDTQRKWRAILMARVERETFLLLKSTTIMIQRRFRATITMKEQMVKFQAQRDAAVAIQRKWRATLMMRAEREKFRLLKSTTVMIQRRFRTTVAMREQMVKFQAQREAAVAIQRKWRATLMMRAERETFLLLKSTTVMIQRRFRATVAMKEQMVKFHAQRDAAVAIQRKWRATLKMRAEREKFLLLRSTTIMVQRRFRATVATRGQMVKLQAQRDAAVVIQRKWRATLAAKIERDKFLRLKRSVTVIQQRWRATLLMKVEAEKFLFLRCAAITIQRRFRATIVMREEVARLEVLRKATIVIQRRFRAKMLTRFEHDKFQKLKKVTVFVQRKFRAKLAIRDYQTLRNSAIAIQRRFRAKLIARMEFDRFQQMKRATIIIQRKWRATLEMRSEMRRYEDMRNAAITIQRHYRARPQKLKQATILIQRRWRAILAMRIEKKKFQEMRNAAIVIHRIVRQMLQRKRELERILDNTVIIDIQKYARGYLIRQKFASHFSEEAKAERRLLRMKHKAAREIQAAWRGYRTRQARTPQLYAVYKKLQAANASAKPQDTLGARCRNAMLHLMKRNISLLEILQVLTDLDFVTRRDQKSCLKLAACLPKHLYETAVSTNRSPPEMQVTTVAVSILINFYRFLPTRAHAWVPEYVGKIVTVMLHSCDKEGELFPTICSLIYFFLKNEEYKAVITGSEKFVEKMRHIQGKCERKRKMVSRTNFKYSSFFAPYTNLPLPSDAPDWGIEYKHKPRIFSNSNYAVDSIVTMLNL